jgi:acetolactate synthase-1/2/3 large subunit
MTGGAALAEMFRLHEAGPMFGMGGFQLLPFYDGVRRLGLSHYLTNDERSGAFAADAYARVSGRPGICDGTLGPGATNLVTGMLESLNAGVPMIVLIGDTNREHSRKNMTQEGNQVEILRPAAKELIRVESPARIPELVRRAFAVATSGRPGPVVLNLPEDVCHADHSFAVAQLYADPVTLSNPSRRSRPAAQDIARAASLIARARRPLLLVGGGIHLSGAYDALERLAVAQSIPVAHTMSGKGAIACRHPLSAGLFGRYHRIANDLIPLSDCLVVVGCKLGEIATRRYSLMPDGVPIIHLDNVAEEFGRTTQAACALWGDAREGLADLAQALDEHALRARRERAGYVNEIPERMRKWRDETAARRLSEETPIHVARLVEEISNALPADGILVADGGFTAHWTSLVYETKIAGRGYVADRGSASIGYGVSGAIGSQLAAPDRVVVGMTGDGGLNMTLGDLEMARRVSAPVTMVVVNNAASGYVKALQHLMYEGAYQSSDLSEMNYAVIANAMGCHGIRVEDPKDLAGALKEGMAERRVPTVIDVVVTRDASKMLPAVDSRVIKVEKGDRPI